MGVSVAAASAIMFTTFVILFGGIFGAVQHYQNSISNAQNDYLELEMKVQETEISLISVNNTTDIMVLSNTGSASIILGNIDVLIDGVIVDKSTYSTEVAGVTNTQLWAPGEQLNMHFDSDLDGKRIKVTVQGWATIYYDQ